MKTTRILLVAGLACFLVVGCEKPKSATDCNGCNDMPCEEYAPAGVTVSWTDYNLPSELRAYFNCHRATLTEHLGDTIQLSGWVYYQGENEPNFTYPGDWDVNRGWLLLVDNENHHGYHQSAVYVKWKEWLNYTTVADSIWLEDHASFRDHFDEYLQKKWYVVAEITEEMLYGTGCCDHDPRYKIIFVDTIPIQL